MTGKVRKQFEAEQRAAHLTVILTRRDDLTATAIGADTGLDYLVVVDRPDSQMRVGFALMVRAGLAASAAAASAALRPAVGQFMAMRKQTAPVCVFYFSRSDARAYYAWLAEPVVTPAGPKLVHHAAAACAELTREALDQLVGQVVAWYDAVEPVLTA